MGQSAGWTRTALFCSPPSPPWEPTSSSKACRLLVRSSQVEWTRTSGTVRHRGDAGQVAARPRPEGSEWVGPPDRAVAQDVDARSTDGQGTAGALHHDETDPGLRQEPRDQGRELFVQDLERHLAG